MGASDRKYNLELELCVTFRIGREYDTELLERQIRAIDEIAPWKSTYIGGEPAPSIRSISHIPVVEGHGVDRLYRVRIKPSFLHTFDQAHAYETYGDRLASNLVRVLPSDVLSVQCRLIINGCYGESYRPERPS